MSKVNELVLAALVLVARRKVARQARGGVWYVPAGQPWCPEMASTLNVFLDQGVVYVVPNTGGRAGLTELGHLILLDELPPQLHRWVFPS